MREHESLNRAEDYTLNAIKTKFYAPDGAASTWAKILLREWLNSRYRFETEVTSIGGYAHLESVSTDEDFDVTDYSTVENFLSELNGEKRFDSGFEQLISLFDDFEEALGEAEQSFIVNRCGVSAQMISDFVENNEIILEWRDEWLSDFVKLPFAQVISETPPIGDLSTLA